MRLSVSMLGWPLESDSIMYEFLARENCFLEAAPGRLWPQWKDFNEDSAKRIRDGIPVRISSFQSLAFGRDDCFLFGTALERDALMRHLKDVVNVTSNMRHIDASDLSPMPLVFGSMKTRARKNVSLENAVEISVPFFREIGEHAARHNMVFCLEPIPSCYGCDFMTTFLETAKIVRLCDCKGVRLMLDTGSAFMANEQDIIEEAIVANADILCHVHISEKGLGSFDDASEAWHTKIAASLKRIKYAGIATVELINVNAQAVQNAVRFVKRLYY